MKNKNKSIAGKIPQLRFPEFQDAGEWKETTIGGIGSFYYGKSAPKWSLEENTPTQCVRYGELYTKFGAVINETYSRTNIDPNNLRFSKGGEILVPRVGEKPEDFGKCCCYLPLANIAIGEMISVFETAQNPLFYTYYFRHLYRQFAKVVEGQNVKNLYYDELEPLPIFRTSLTEQQKIADCLTSIDELIAAHTQKLIILTSYKNGLLQLLFPSEGETLPKLRFPEFRDAGEWKVIPLSQLAKRCTLKNGQGKYNRVLTNSAEFGVVDQRDFFDKDIANQSNLEGYLVVEKGDYVYNPRISAAAPVGPLSKNNVATGVMSPLYTVFRFNNSQNDFYAYYFKTTGWHQYMRQTASTGARHDRMAITAGDFMAMPLPVTSPHEQQKIADCLTSIDELIAAHTQKLEILKAHKKGLMQQLFPSADEVNG